MSDPSMLAQAAPHEAILSTSRAQSMLVLPIVFVSLSTFFVAARLVAKRLREAKFSSDDLLIVIALVFFYLQTVCQLYLLFGAWNGHHIEEVPDPRKALIIDGKASVAALLAYIIVMGCVRCSICILFLRVFTQKYYRMLAYANLGMNVCWTIYSILIVALRCIPFSKNWDPTKAGHCLNEVQVILSLTIWGLICDVVTWTLPVPMIWKIQIRLSYKIGLTAIMGLGLVAVAVGGVRIWSVLTLDIADLPWTGAMTGDWGFVEAGAGIICACGPITAPVLERVFDASSHVYSWLSSLRSRSSRTTIDPDTTSSDSYGAGKNPLVYGEKPTWSISKGPVSMSADGSVVAPDGNPVPSEAVGIWRDISITHEQV